MVKTFFGGAILLFKWVVSGAVWVDAYFYTKCTALGFWLGLLRLFDLSQWSRVGSAFSFIMGLVFL